MAKSVLGTWLMNETLQLNTGLSTTGNRVFSIDGVYHSWDTEKKLVELPFVSVKFYRYKAKSTITLHCPDEVSAYTFNSYYIQNGSIALSGNIRVSYTSDYSLRYCEPTDADFEKMRTFTITGGADVENETFIAWLEANATLVEEEPIATAITYNGSTIASLGEGQSATLPCQGKKAKTDILVRFGANGSITYNGITTKVESGKTATLQCAGKKMISDVYINQKKEDYTVTLIIDGYPYDLGIIEANETKTYSGYSDDHGLPCVFTAIGADIEVVEHVINFSGTDQYSYDITVYNATDNVVITGEINTKIPDLV